MLPDEKTIFDELFEQSPSKSCQAPKSAENCDSLFYAASLTLIYFRMLFAYFWAYNNKKKRRRKGYLDIMEDLLIRSTIFGLAIHIQILSEMLCNGMTSPKG
ncbi:hypothetical protein ACKWTF_012422 [Chironomus riparius]